MKCPQLTPVSFIMILMLGMTPFLKDSLCAQNILLFEDFESGDFAAKGWYDGFPDQRTTEEFKNGSHAYEGTFYEGATTSGAGRHLFSPTEKVYMSYWVKYSANYIGSGVGYHPHEWNILTDKDGIYQGPSDTYLTLYVEQNAGRPILALQDSKNVDPNCILLNNNSFVGCNGDFSTYDFTENRSVCSCNGLQGDVDRRDCFPSSGNTKGYYSSRAWAADSIYFRDESGPYNKNEWHFIECYFEMNTIEAGVGIPNGKIRYWYDGQILISSDSILFKTDANPDMKFNQLFYGPYIGVGSPVEQTWWVDDLTIADGIPTTGTHQTKTNTDWVNIYPNPNDGNFIIDCAAEYFNGSALHLEITNSVGAIIYHNTHYANPIPLSIDLPPGLYNCQLENEDGLFLLKRIIISSQ